MFEKKCITHFYINIYSHLFIVFKRDTEMSVYLMKPVTFYSLVKRYENGYIMERKKWLN